MASRFMYHHNKQWEELDSLSPDYVLTWKDYLISLDLDEARAQNLISELSECRCCERHQCERHQCGRPSRLCKVVTHSPGTEDHQCRCPCRHNIRNLCRIFCP